MRTNGKQIVDNKVFNLASNLFGFEIPAQKELKEKVASEKVALDQDPTGMMVYPAIVDEAFAESMANYRKYVSLKNFQVAGDNQEIKDWNNEVRNFKMQNKHTLNEVQIAFSKQFPTTYKNLEPTQYNAKVEEFVKEYGMLVRKKKLITIKPVSEQYFSAFLFMYNQQLMKKNSRFISCGITHATPVEPFHLNARKVTMLKRHGADTLPVCRKSVLAHKRRFEEFGILVDSEFHGWQRAVTTTINVQIIVFKDLYNQKICSTENQSLTSKKGNKVTVDIEKFTRTSIKEAERTGKVENSSFDKEFPSVTPFNLLLTGTLAGNSELSTGAAAKNVKVLETPSEIALSTIISDGELARRLENHEFNNYKP